MADAEVNPAVPTSGGVQDRIRDDLDKSGLVPADMRVRPLDSPERTTTGTPSAINGYVIPYFDIHGKLLPFYRVRLFDYDPKYRQIANEPNHIYFPQGFMKALANSRALIITEGEKKAACAVKMGVACVGLSGVDSWRNRLLIMPKDTQLVTAKDGRLLAKLKAGSETNEKLGPWASGMEDLIALARARDIPIVLCFDTDIANGQGPLGTPTQKKEVAAACARMAFELRHAGIPMRNIRKMLLNGYAGGPDKIGLDDYLVSPHLGLPAFDKQLDYVLSTKKAFPVHPNMAEYVGRKLQKGKLGRSELQTLSFAILSDIDMAGNRLRNPDNDALYFFDDTTKELCKTSFRMTDEFSKTPFGIWLYKKYGITLSDNRILLQLAAQYPAEEPLFKVRPEHVMTVRGNILYYQISNGRVAKVQESGIEIIDNGADGVLFEGQNVIAVDEDVLKAHIKKYQAVDILPNLWLDALRTARIKDSEDDKQRKLLSLLYHISPWFYKWNHTQLPIEMMLGEAGSGKSSLYELRMSIQTGIPMLRNMPREIRDWTASVANSGGLHVTDNVHFNDNNMRQLLSDELCRVVTATNPMIESRKLYSDNELVHVPVNCVFAVTAIRQPFTNVDIVQRSIITELDKGEGEIEYDADWVNTQIKEPGGREAWLAHQFAFQQKMFGLIRKKWQHNYKAKYRLINVEQLIQLAGEVVGTPAEWVTEYIAKDMEEKAVAGDWALDGMKQFAQNALEAGNAGKAFFAASISEWASEDEEFRKCNILVNTRMLGKYISSNRNLLAQVIGLEHLTIRGGRQAYALRPVDPK